jgi:hypothetical protein
MMVLRPDDDANERGSITWDYHDVTTAEKIGNVASPATRKNTSFQKVERHDYHFQVEQKVGMAVHRNYQVTADDAGMSNSGITTDEL